MRSINVAEYQNSEIVMYFLFQNLHQEQEKASGDANLGKYFSEGYIFGIKGMYYVIVIPLLGSRQVLI